MMREILCELTRSLNEGRECVLCSLVETRGSTPQKAGAAMLVFPDGSQRGTLGGGCVEAEVKQRALRILADAGTIHSSLVTCPSSLFTFNLDNDYGWDDGLICGGRMTILALPMAGQRAAGQEYVRRFSELLEAGQGCTEAVLLAESEDTAPGTRFLLDADGNLVSSLPNAGQDSDPVTPAMDGGQDSDPVAGTIPPQKVTQHLPPLHSRPRATTIPGVAYLPILPRITLLIVGGGHVGEAVGRLAAECDFDIWVVDDREKYASRERFPKANNIIVDDIGRALSAMKSEINNATYCIIVTRGHAHDEEALYHLATSEAGYVGMIGSKRKIRLIYEDLLAKGIPQEALDRVQAPLGFDIGSQTVPEIAVSIVAQLIARRNLGDPKGERGV